MTYDFDKIHDRKSVGYSMKWDIKEGELPLWVADMDFQTAPEIRQALAERLEHGIFGYSIIPDEWADAYIGWWDRRHHIRFSRDELIFCTGVIPAISTTVRKMTTPAEKVVMLTPIYNTFYNSIVNNGRYPLESPMVYENGEYHVDYADLEEKLSDPQASLMIFCNPHNPIGKIWTKDEMAKIGALCKKYGVLVLSDEIHCDLVDPGLEYLPFASASEDCKMNSITCIAPTKTFNMAGMQTAAVAIPNPFIRHKIWRGLNTDEVAEPNSFAIVAAIAGFEKGEPWLEELRTYLYENKKYVRDFIEKNIPEIKVLPSQATYLLWLNIESVPENKIPGGYDGLADFIREKTGLYLSAGSHFGGDGVHFLRLNAACPRSILVDAMGRLKDAIMLI